MRATEHSGFYKGTKACGHCPGKHYNIERVTKFLCNKCQVYIKGPCVIYSTVTQNRFGQRASSYSQVMDACRHYWNTCQTGITSVAGRAMLLDQLVELLQILSTLSSRRAIVRTGAYCKQGRLVGLNFHGFQEYRESFTVNIYKLCIMALFKCFKCT